MMRLGNICLRVSLTKPVMEGLVWLKCWKKYTTFHNIVFWQDAQEVVSFFLPYTSSFVVAPYSGEV
jgi:hypothetical protein